MAKKMILEFESEKDRKVVYKWLMGSLQTGSAPQVQVTFSMEG